MEEPAGWCLELFTVGKRLSPCDLGEKEDIQAAFCVFHNLCHRGFEYPNITMYNNETDFN